MKNSKKAMGIALAITAAGMMSATAPVFAGSADAKVQCFGVNECKGHNDCKTANNACKGHASCKGQGFINMTKEECDRQGGKVGK